MGTRTPHGRTLGAVQHPELKRSCICHQTGVSAQGIHFADNLALGDATYSRVATHLGQTVQIRSKQQNGRAQVGRSHGRFTAGMATPHYNDVETIVHTRLRCDR